jgi:transposase
MVGVSKIEIKESSEQLKELMHLQTSTQAKERLQVLYLLKSLQAQDITAAARLVGRDRVTVQRWMLKYKAGGIVGLIEEHSRSGRPRSIPEAVSQALEAELSKREGFKSYVEIQEWLKREHDLEIEYRTVHLHVRYRLGAKLKEPRPLSVDQDEPEVFF